MAETLRYSAWDQSIVGNESNIISFVAFSIVIARASAPQSVVCSCFLPSRLPTIDIREKSLKECKKAINNFIIKLSTDAKVDWLARDKCWC